MSLYNSDSSAEYISIVANGSKRMKRSTSRERERERQRRRRQQQQQQPLTVDRESQHSREMVLESQNSRSDCYFEDFGTDDYDYGDGNTHNNEQEGYADVEDNSTPQQTRQRLPRAQRRYNRKTILDEEWAKLLPKLRDAYFRGIGQNDIDITTLDPPATFECSCIVKKTATVVCIFKCGVRKHDISFCDNCPDGSRSLPVVLLEKQLFPTTPTDTKIAIHIDVLRCYNNVRLYARAPINSIAELMKADCDQTDLPATLRNTLYHALLNYSKFKLLVDDHINGFCKLARGICPFCDYMASEGLMVPVSLDGNFQLKRLDQTSHSFVNDPCAETVNTLWKANTNILSPGNKPQSSVTNVRTEFSLSNDSIQLTTQRSYNYDNIACDGWKSLSKTGIKRKSVPTTGVFMAMCSRHSFVLSLMDMNTTGEKADYPLSVLYQIKNTYGNNIAILYDVACKMGKGLKHTPQLSDLANVPRAIGAFHVYGHDAPCQVPFNPKVVKGIGLVDGEDCERYWSVCSPFVTATRYMTEYNRHLFFTILTDHYHEQKLKSLGRIIFKKYGKAKNILKDSNDKLRRIDVEELARHWEEFKYGTIEGRSSNMRSRRMNEKDKLRAAVLAYDCFNEVMHGGRLGNKRAMEMQVQLSKALKKVDNIVQEYNNNNPTSPLITKDILKKESAFRRECNILGNEGRPYLAMHLRERATEELYMLKKDAINVTRFFSEQITALRFAMNNMHSYNNEFEERGVKTLLKHKVEKVHHLFIRQSDLLFQVVSDGEPDDVAVDVKVFEKYYIDANGIDNEQQLPVEVDHVNIDMETSEVDLNTTTDDDDDDDIASIISLLAQPEQLTENEDME